MICNVYRPYCNVYSEDPNYDPEKDEIVPLRKCFVYRLSALPGDGVDDKLNFGRAMATMDNKASLETAGYKANIFIRYDCVVPDAGLEIKALTALLCRLPGW